MDEKTIKDVYIKRKSFELLQVDDSDIQHKHLLAWLPENRETRILDAGCGNGKRALKLQQAGYRNITGVDLFDTIPVSDIRYVKASIDNLPFHDNSFDFIYSMSVIYYPRDPEKAIMEFNRVLEDNGIVLMTAHTKYSLFTLKRVIFRFLGYKSASHLKGVKFKSADEYKKILKRSGFEILSIDGFYLSFFLIPAYDYFRKAINKVFNVKLPEVKTSISSLAIMRRIKSVIGYHMVLVAKKAHSV